MSGNGGIIDKVSTTAKDDFSPHPHPAPPPEGEGKYASSPFKGEVRRGMG
jgi:hypothetical protein